MNCLRTNPKVIPDGPHFRSIAFVVFAFTTLVLSNTTAIVAQTKNDRPREENLGLEYVAQYSEMSKYMAYVVGQEDDQEGNRVAVFHFEAIYAYRNEKRGKSTERFERKGRWIATDDQTRDIDERSLKNAEHDWVERYGSIFDAKLRDPEKNPDDHYTPVYGFDPFALPLTYTNTIGASGEGGANRACIDLMMPHGRMYDSVSKGGGVDIGVWFHGRDVDLGVTIFKFDEKFGGMPTEMSMRICKKGRPNGALDKSDPIGTTEPYEKKVVQWGKHPQSGFWLPTAIESEMLTKNPRSYDIKIMWWIDSEVPDEIFELDDLKKAVLQRSKAHELIELRKESKDKK